MKDGEKMGRNKSSTVVKYQKEHYNTLSLRFKKEDDVLLLLDYASKTLGITKGDYVRDALMTQFRHDGITIDMLPADSKYTPPVPESKQPKRYMIYMVTTWDATPEEYEEVLAGNGFVFEEYVSVFQTLAMAKKYIANKYTKKPYPEQWYFTIYGREIEAENKLEAANKYRQMTKDAIAEENEGLYSEEGTEDFTELLNKYRKPDYMEIVKYDDVRNDKEGN